MNRPAVTRFASCAREDFRRLVYHLRGLLDSELNRHEQARVRSALTP